MTSTRPSAMPWPSARKDNAAHQYQNPQPPPFSNKSSTMGCGISHRKISTPVCMNFSRMR